jgi:DNA helicase HerA-like ATPase
MNSDPRDRARVLIGQDSDGRPVHWTLDKDARPALPNFGLLVSGDAGQGKTQVIKAVIAEVARLGCPILVFDFKNDYADAPGDRFASDNGLVVVDLNDGLPFNPLKLPPQGPSGAQAIDHVYEVAGILSATLKLGDQQKALLRDALQAAFERLGVPLREWVDPEPTPAPALDDVVEIATELDERRAESLINRLGLLHGKRLLPSDPQARIRFDELLAGRVVLSFNALPNDDQLKRALAELVLIQLQGRMLRGDQPRALRRLLVFDEAWRAADSARLIQLAREGRAFGVGVVAGSQFADDLSPELTGNLATKLNLYNSDAGQRRKVVQATFGTTAGRDAAQMMEHLGRLERFQGVLANQQHVPYREVEVLPYYRRARRSGPDEQSPPSGAPS